MYTINDPMFALLLRFVGCSREITVKDDAFIKKELKAIQHYIGRFPEKEREARALEWIEKHAREYRKMWEKETVRMEFSNERCPDCPLAAADGESEICAVHEEWLNLLKRYAADQIRSAEYVENALKLLAKNKESLKIKLSQLKGGRGKSARRGAKGRP